MTIQTGMEHTAQCDEHHTYNAILEMAIADFFIAKISLVGLWNLLISSNYWTRQNMGGATLKFHTGKNWLQYKYTHKLFAYHLYI